MKEKLYVVGVGERPGLYEDYESMSAAVGTKRNPRPEFGKFNSEEEAAFALRFGVENYRKVRACLQQAPISLPGKLYVVTSPQKQPKMFASKAESDAYQKHLTQHDMDADARSFDKTQLAEALRFFEAGAKSVQLENIPLMKYEVINRIFAPENMPTPSSEMEARMRFFARMEQVKKGARLINPYKYPKPKALRGKDGKTLDLSKEAEAFRTDVRAFLEVMNGKDLSKFDSDNDAISGEFTEQLVRNYLISKYASANIEVHRYGDLFSETAIQRIMDKYTERDASGRLVKKPGVDISENELEYVNKYFFDAYDLILTRNWQQATIDVKTATTTYQAQSTWDFLYPEIQVERYERAIAKGEPTKEYILAVYCDVKDRNDMNTAYDAHIAGITSMETFVNADKIGAGKRTPHGTRSQIDNRMIQLYQLDSFSKFIEDFILQTEFPQQKAELTAKLVAGKSFSEAYKEVHAGDSGVSMMQLRINQALIGRDKMLEMATDPSHREAALKAFLDTQPLESHRQHLDALIADVEPTEPKSHRAMVRDDDAR